MTADGILSEFETESHYIQFKCVQCSVAGFVEPTRRKRIYCGIKCNDMAFADRRKAETAQRRQAKIDQLKARTEKACTKCGETKPVSQFGKTNKNLDGYNSECKDCKMVVSKAWAQQNRQRLRELDAQRRHRPESRAKILEAKKRARDKARELRPHKERAVVLHQAHVYAFMRLSLHCEHVNRWAAYAKECRILHDAHVKEFRSDPNRVARWKYNHIPQKKLYQRIKAWSHKHLKSGMVSKKWSYILGYTVDELKVHIEKQFTKGMSWEKRSEIHIDHIIPVSSFNITDIYCEDFKSCFALSNLRPLWAKENMQKSDKILTLL